jgi:hypothetical protein
MQNLDLTAMINAEILDYFSSFDTCEDEIKEHDDTFSIEFKNNSDTSHTVNEKHANNSIKMQKKAGEFYYLHNLTVEEKEQFANFQEWNEKANDEQKEGYDEFESDYINYSHLNCGHDNLYLFSIVWKIRHEKDGVFIDIGEDVNHYAFLPKLDDKIKHTIKVDVDNLQDIQSQLKLIL